MGYGNGPAATHDRSDQRPQRNVLQRWTANLCGRHVRRRQMLRCNHWRAAWHRTQQHKEMVLCLCESDDGRFLATSARDGTIGVWCTRTGALITGLDEMGDPRVIAWSPDMSKITICQFGGRIDNFRWKDNLLEHESSSAERESQVMKLAPDGLTFASSVLGESLQLRDAEQGRPIRQFYGHRGQIRAICFDQHGRRMLTAGADGTCRLWDMTRIVGYSQKTLGSQRQSRSHRIPSHLSTIRASHRLASSPIQHERPATH